jgi:hypothetical protein
MTKDKQLVTLPLDFFIEKVLKFGLHRMIDIREALDDYRNFETMVNETWDKEQKKHRVNHVYKIPINDYNQTLNELKYKAKIKSDKWKLKIFPRYSGEDIPKNKAKFYLGMKLAFDMYFNTETFIN